MNKILFAVLMLAGCAPKYQLVGDVNTYPRLEEIKTLLGELELMQSGNAMRISERLDRIERKIEEKPCPNNVGIDDLMTIPEMHVVPNMETLPVPRVKETK